MEEKDVVVQPVITEEDQAKLKRVKKQKVKRGKAKIYGHRINEVMAEQDMCHQELADLINSNGPHVHRILKNERLCLSLPIAMKIGAALKTPIEELFFLDKATALIWLKKDSAKKVTDK